MVKQISDEQITKYIKRHSEFVTNRSNWENHWTQIAEIMSPFNDNFNTIDSPGIEKMSHVFDSTCIHAAQLLAAGLFSLMTNPAQQWHEYKMIKAELNDVYDVKIWLETITTIAFHEINKTDAKFNAAMHEGYMEYGPFGNMIIYIGEDKARDSLSFQCLPLSTCFMAENENGFVDTIYRKYNRTTRQLIQRFGEDNVSEHVLKLFNEGKTEQIIESIHIVEPVTKYTENINPDFEYTSIYLDTQHKHIMHNKGYYEQPFAAARFYKSAHEVNGRGPGSTALPDGKMLQEIMRTTIRAAQKAVDPPLAVPDEGFLNPVRTMPGGINYYRAGTGEKIEALNMGVQPKIGYDMMQDIRKRIQEVFFVDQLQLQEGPQMTATEVLQRTEEKLRLMGPMMGRLQSELLGPLLNRVFAILYRNGKFPQPPEVLSGQDFRVVYTSPIARAQEQTEANGLMRATQLLAPFFDMNPQAIDNYNVDKVIVGVNSMFSVPTKYLNTDDEKKAIRAARAQAQKAKELSENLRAAGQGADSMARAAETVGPEGMQEMQEVLGGMQ